MNQEDVIRNYFKTWLDNNIDVIKETFTDDIIYSECYGPEYHGISQIIKWFADWNKKGKVLEWSIKRIISQNNICVAEWYFKCDYDSHIDGFDGVTIADFDEQLKISKLCEFQSKAEHVFPYNG